MEYCIGIDIGTTNLKVILFDLMGNIVSSAFSSNPVYIEGKFHYFLPDEIWGMVKNLINKVAAEVKGEVASVAVASIAESVIPIGGNGEVLFPAIAWYDERTEEQVRWVIERLEPNIIYGITGLYPLPKYSINKILWMKKYKREIFDKTKIWLPMSDFIAYKLSGEIATDYSQASRFMAFDLRSKDWSGKILDALEIPRETLPKPLPSGTVLGEVRKADDLGIKSKAVVTTGGHDHICGAFIVGCYKRGLLLDSMGTAETFLLSLRNLPSISLTEESPNIVLGAHVMKDTYTFQLGIPFSGGLIEWTTNLMQALTVLKNKSRMIEYFSKLAEESPPGSNGFFCLPHFSGSTVPIRDIHSKGVFLGLRRDHTPSDMARGILEGLSFEAKFIIKELEKFDSIRKVVGIGGGAKNLFWLKIKSSVINKEIEIPKITEATAMGAAFLGVLGIRLFKDEDEIIKNTYKVYTVIEPDNRLSSLYEELFERIYSKLFFTLRDLNHSIDSEVKTYGSNT